MGLTCRHHALSQRRLQQCNDQEAFALRIQYRMAARIRDWPGRTFYKGSIVDAPALRERESPKALDHCDLFPYSVVNVDGTEAMEGTSFFNEGEARRVKQLLEFLRDKGMRVVGETAQVGVITGYAAQVRCIKALLKTTTVEGADVKTVDGFQGSERDVIIVSIVRANDTGRVGFWGQERRLNVALTRARFGLVVLGNKRTMAMSACMQHFAYFAKLLENARRSNCALSERDFEEAIGLSNEAAPPPSDETNFPGLPADATGNASSAALDSADEGSQEDAKACPKPTRQYQSQLLDGVIRTLEEHDGSIAVDEFVANFKRVVGCDIGFLCRAIKLRRRTVGPPRTRGNNNPSCAATDAAALCHQLSLLFHEHVEMRTVKVELRKGRSNQLVPMFMTRHHGDTIRNKNLHQRKFLMCKVRWLVLLCDTQPHRFSRSGVVVRAQANYLLNCCPRSARDCHFAHGFSDLNANSPCMTRVCRNVVKNQTAFCNTTCK